MAWKWLCQLEEHYPHLAERAKAMNKRDKFLMKYDPSNMEEGKHCDGPKPTKQRISEDSISFVRVSRGSVAGELDERGF